MSEGAAKVAIVMGRREVGREEAVRLVDEADGHVGRVVGGLS